MASNPWQKKNPEDRCLSLFIALRWMQRPERVMVGLAENIQACLRDFQTGTASMARKRHLASSARGLFGLCLMASQDTLPHIALCCLEGSTLSNLVHRRRRCARIVLFMILLPGGQYAKGRVFISVYRLAIDVRTLEG